MNIFYLKNCLCTTCKKCKKRYANLTIYGVKGREKNDFNTRPSKRWIWKLCFLKKGTSRVPGVEGKKWLFFRQNTFIIKKLHSLASFLQLGLVRSRSLGCRARLPTELLGGEGVEGGSPPTA